MNEHDEHASGKRSLRDLWKLVLAIVAILAIIKELQKPAAERTWHGTIADFFPYDFRMPTVERLKDTYWDPKGPVIKAKAFGVGWAPNLGAIKDVVQNALRD
ncbi:MAG: hypothetical protein R3290_03090 [Acidimicrobiia bacterium]|nr:hypothetical protein [Acidimicrobiia bacterium]